MRHGPRAIVLVLVFVIGIAGLRVAATADDRAGAAPHIVSCNVGALAPVGAKPFVVTDFVTGFPVTSENCLNPAGMAFDSSGNLYVADYAGSSAEGGIYKFGASGGTVGSRLNATPYAAGTCASGLAFSKDGAHLYLARQFCGTGGDVVEVSTTDGSVLRTLADDIPCATGLATDPISGDLFVSQPCPPGSGSGDVTRVASPESDSPEVSTYASPGFSGTLVFSPDGTLYTESFRFDVNGGTRFITEIAGTGAADPGSFTYLTEAFSGAFGVVPVLDPDATSQPPFLLAANGGDISLVNLTTSSVTQTSVLNGGSIAAYAVTGPDGCVYATQSDRIVRISAVDQSCNLVFLGHFMTYLARSTKSAPTFSKFGPVTLADLFGSAAYDVLKPTTLAAPASKNDEGFGDAATHLAAYAIKPAKGSPKFQPRVDVHLVNQCGTFVVTATKPVGLLLPTTKALNAPVSPPQESAHNVDHFLCYQAKRQKTLTDGTPLAPFPKGSQADVADQFQSRRYDLKKVAWLCNPVSKSGTPTLLAGPDKGAPFPIAPASVRNPDSRLLCYAVKLAKKRIDQTGCAPTNPADKGSKITPPQAKHTPRLGIHVANQFETGELDTKKESVLCMPSVFRLR